MKTPDELRCWINHFSSLGIYSEQTDKSVHCCIRIGDFANWNPDFSNVKKLSCPDTSKSLIACLSVTIFVLARFVPQGSLLKYGFSVR
jgi:hypothetical protein